MIIDGHPVFDKAGKMSAAQVQPKMLISQEKLGIIKPRRL